MKIGEFARLSNVTIRTLRYYDDLGLLKPDSIDRFTGYRFYSAAKLERMLQIQALKDIGFTLLEIKGFLAIDEADEDKQVDFVASKRQEIEQERQKAETRLHALDEFITTLKERGDHKMSANYYYPFADDEEIAKLRADFEATTDKVGSRINSAAKLVKIYAYGLVFGAIDESGAVYMWGNNVDGQCDVPEDLPPIAELGIGGTHAVALDVNGGLHAWGKSDHGAIDFPGDLPKIISIKAASYSTLALSEDGRIFNWGEANGMGQKHVPKNMGAVKLIASSPYCALAINSENKIFSWGAFSGAELPAVDCEIATLTAVNGNIICLGADGKIYGGDIKQTEMHRKFKPMPEMSGVRKLVSGIYNPAALDADGKVYIWGAYYEAPDGGAIVNIPLNLPPVVDVAVGSFDIMCLGADGKIYAWGGFGGILPPAFDGFRGGAVFEPVAVAAVDVNAPRDVYTFDELREAVSDRVKNITIKADMTIAGDSFHVMNDITLTIGEGVTLSVGSMNFIIQKKLINNGMIAGSRGSVFSSGRIVVYSDIEGTGGVDLPSGVNIEINGVAADKLAEYLAEDSIYSKVMYTYGDNEDAVVSIDSDLVIPEGKELWLNINTTLKVSRGVTLTVKGYVQTFKPPIIEGTVVGSLSDDRDIYTYEDLRELTVVEMGKMYRSIPKLTIKGDITVNDEFFRIIAFVEKFIVGEGATLTVNSLDFNLIMPALIRGNEVINNGVINGTGRLTTSAPITGAGRVDTSGGLRVEILDPDADELGKYLAEDSSYSKVIYTNIEGPYQKTVFFPKRENSAVQIGRDVFIPRGKSLWLHPNCTLKVAAGATLTIEGRVETFNAPVIDGAIVGEITVIAPDTRRDVSSFAEFYEAALDYVSVITIKGEVTVPSMMGDPIEAGTLIIGEGATLIGDDCNFGVAKNLIINGAIAGKGRIHIYDRFECTGSVVSGFELYLNTREDIGADGIDEYLAEGSLVNTVLFIPGKERFFTIDRDVVIPEGKYLSFTNPNGTLKVCEGATLTVKGKVETYNEPVIEGTVIGEITVRPRRHMH